MSKNGIGILVMALSILGVNVSESETMQFVTSAGTVISFVLMIWNQLGRKDIWGFFFRKK